MDDQPQKGFKRAWFRFPMPRKQLLLFLPTATVLAALIGVVAFSVNRVRSRGLEALDVHGATSEVSREFLQQTRGMSLVLYGVTAAVGMVAVLWVWWLSVWIFGPYRRLERDLNEVLYGRMDPGQLRVRKGDALFPIIERVRDVLTKKKG